MKAFLMAVGAVVVLSASASPISATTLADLLAGGSITVGDKTFDNFSNGSISCVGSCTFTSNANFADITVTGGTFNGLIGLNFTGGIGVGTSSSLDIFFEYDVTSTWASITDVHMDMNGSILPAGGNFFVSISEDVYDGANIVASIQVDDDPIGDKTYTADVIGGPYQSLHVIKDILLFTSSDTEGILSGFKQTWSQIPEPASVMLLGTAFSALAFFGRRRLAGKVNG